jgi:hypothetical protein
MNRATTLAAALLAALMLITAACVPEEGPMMEPGHDCMECHDGGEAKAWTVAGTIGGFMGGTIGALGQQIQIVDAAGKSFTLRVNKAGNFWSSEPVQLPLQPSRDGNAMPALAPSGSCNRTNGCHGNAGGGGGD